MHAMHTLSLVVTLVSAGITSEVHAGDSLRLPAAQLLSAPSRDVSIGDIDRDGLVDVVLAASALGQVRLHHATSQSTFEPPEFVVATPSSLPVAVRVTDLNEDGRLDILALNAGSQSLKASYQLADGSFVGTSLSGVFAQPVALGLGDVNGDGRPDALVGNLATGTTRILPATFPNGFGVGPQLVTGRAPTAIATGDLDEDGRIDFATSNFDDDDLSVLLNLGEVTFGAPSSYACPDPQDVVLSDLDGDGHLDLVSLGSLGARVRPGLGDGTFGAELSAPSLFNGVNLELSDLDLDGDLDVLIAQRDGLLDGLVLSVLNGGAGLLFAASGVRATSDLRAVTAADFDGDGIPDAVVCDGSDARTTILHGRGDGTLVAPGRTTVDDNTLGPLVADYDLDGHLDALLQRLDGAKPLRIRPGLGDGTFGVPVTSSPASAVEAVLPLDTGDVDGDGLPDVVLSLNTQSFDGLRVLHGEGDLSATQSVDSDLGDAPQRLLLIDVDGDGDLDAVALLPFENALLVALGDGSGAFAPSATELLGASQGYDLAVADADLDGAPDVVVSTFAATVETFTIPSDGSLVPGPVLSLGATASALTLADLDDDGLAELVLLSPPQGAIQQVQVLPGLGALTFGAPQLVASGLEDGTSLTPRDLDADGRLDLVVGGQGVVILPGLGGGLFDVPRRFLGGRGPLATGDFDEDGLLDVLVLDGDDDVLLSCPNDLLGSWTNLGHALAADDDVPRLVGKGDMQAGSLVALRTTRAAALANCWLVLGLSTLDAPFRGGTLVPAPDLVIPLTTDADGNLLVVIPWPAGLPTGAPLVWQVWVQDATGPSGFTSTNGLCQTLP